MNANSNQYGSRAAPESNASGITGEAVALTEQSGTMREEGEGALGPGNAARIQTRQDLREQRHDTIANTIARMQSKRTGQRNAQPNSWAPGHRGGEGRKSNNG